MKTTEKTQHSAKTVILSAQCRAARALLGWSQAELAGHARVAAKTIVDFEGEKRRPHDRTLVDLRRTLQEAGVEFIDENGGGAGARLAKATGKG